MPAAAGRPAGRSGHRRQGALAHGAVGGALRRAEGASGQSPDDARVKNDARSPGAGRADCGGGESG
ncbi:hypothetical protein UM91_14245 [Pseudomonas oryzihabitans]|nr:hypothetical protein UM91_14245 [Pseudomonas oryzihabitans]